MSDREIRGILSEARSALEPTEADRRRVHKKVLAAIGTAGAVTAVATSAANASGGGIGSAWEVLATKATVLKLSIATILVGGAIGIVALMPSESADPGGMRGVAPTGKNPNTSSNKGVLRSETVAIPASNIDAERSSSFSNARGSGLESEDRSNAAGTMRPVGRVKRANRTVKRESETPKVENDTMLFKELSLIRKASRALRNDHPDEAMRFLATYDREITDGVMREERDGLRVLALCAQGRFAEARKARAGFLKRSPQSPLAVRIKDQCGDMESSNE